MAESAIALGLDEAERGKVGSIYWDAFSGKLGRAFVDPGVGLRVVVASMNASRCLVARREDGAVTGVCGFHVGGSGAIVVTWKQLRAALTFWHALRAVAVLMLLDRSEEGHTLVLDGICVERNARGNGNGGHLLDAAETLARSLGKHRIGLTVIENNPRAQALYDRHGFVPVSTGTMGLLRSVYGFDRYISMEKELRP